VNEGEPAPRPPYESPRAERPTGAAGTARDLQPGRLDPYAAFRFTGYRFFALGNFFSVIGRQMLSIAVGWEVYQRTHSATALGLVGLVAALPLILLAIPAGHAADRFERKTILLLNQLMSAATSLGLAALALEHNRIPASRALLFADSILNRIASLCERNGHFHFDPGIPLMLLLLLISGAGRVFGWAARGAFMPNLVPAHSFSNAVTWNSSILQVSSVLGPAMGGFLIARFGFPAVYTFDATCAGLFFCCLLPIHAPQKHEKT